MTKPPTCQNSNAPRPNAATALQPWLKYWALQPDGVAFNTPSSSLQPVLYAGQPAMLKLAYDIEEQWGGLLMSWWAGQGAAHVLKKHENTILLERATGEHSLLDMAMDGRDDQAIHILCHAAKRLHAHTYAPPPHLLPLAHYFSSLKQAAEQQGGLYEQAWQIAQHLLENPIEQVVLHGDLHHENVLDFGTERGWLAIDPKRVMGERGFDYANLFGNPLQVSLSLTQRLEHRLVLVSQLSGLTTTRLLQWIVAQQGLSAAWYLEDNDDMETLPLTILSAALSTGVNKNNA